jgi:hypothetical protein
MILRSRYTLEYLELAYCQIHNSDIEANDFEHRWADIWDSFSRELRVLRKLVVSGMKHVENRYSYFNRKSGAVPMEDGLDGEERDRPALDRFCSVILSRPGGRVKIVDE